MTTDLDRLTWHACTPDDADLLGRLNEQLSRDEGAAPVGPLAAYVDRMRSWLEQGRYQAAMVRSANEPVAYVVWRQDPDYADVYVRQFFVVAGHRGQGIGRVLFERAAEEFWAGQTLRLDVYDSNPRGGAFWESLGFTPYSRLMRRQPTDRG